MNNPITPEMFKERMKEIRGGDNDPESSHEEADALMCGMLKELGYRDGVKIFEEMEKYYSQFNGEF